MGPNSVLSKSARADGPINMFHCVKQSGNENVVQCDDAGEYVLGISQDEIDQEDSDRGRAVTFFVEGISRAVANGEIALNAAVAVAGDGRVKPAAAGDFVLGRCTTAATQANDHIDLHITREGILAE